MLTSIIILIYAAFIALAVIGIVKYVKAYEDEGKKASRGKGMIAIGVIGLVLLTAYLIIAGFSVKLLWFKSLGFASVLLKKFWLKWLLFAIGAILSYAFFRLIAWPVRKAERKLKDDPDKIEGDTIAFHIASAVLAFLFGLWLTGNWDTLLLALNKVQAGVTEPMLGKDVGFYLFTLPLLKSLLTWSSFVIIAGLVLTLIILIPNIDDNYSYSRSEKKEDFGSFAIKFYMAASILLAGIIAAIYKIGIYNLLFTTRGSVDGPGFTTINWQYPMDNMVIAFAAILAVLIIIFTAKKSWKGFVWSWGGFAFIMLLSWILPMIVQGVKVSPNELELEKPYLSNNIAFTQQAFGLTDVEEKTFSYDSLVTYNQVIEDRITLDNIRLWDYRALKLAYQQREPRPYYKINDVDVDRYIINGNYRGVMLAGRELSIEQLPSNAHNWVNTRLKYTHGYGVIMNAVNEVGPDKYPKLLLSGIQSASAAPEITLTRPEIYFGELTTNHIYVKTKTEEFDYSSGDDNTYTTYQGTGGIPLGKGLRKLAFALKLDGIKTLTSAYLDGESRAMFWRDVETCLKKAAPFLEYDDDPYIVIRKDGTLSFITDAYLTSKYYPYATRYSFQNHVSKECPECMFVGKGNDGEHKVNYIRNSVKAVIDAYNGTVDLYVVDESDLLLQAWKNIYPDIFKPFSAMPADLKAHLRYPEDLLRLQTDVYARYHMENLQVFFNSEDLWAIANEKYIDNIIPIEPYEVIVNLPGETKEEFILMRPYTPNKKNNLIAWFAGRSDSSAYGKKVVFKMPKDRFIEGPNNFETMIDQDNEMSDQIGRWKKESEVIRGNTLILPLAKNFLYVEPLYLQSNDSPMPQLTKIMVFFQGKIAWDDTFEGALLKVFSKTTPTASYDQSGGINTGSKQQPTDPLSRAGQLYDRYLQLMGAGKAQEAGQALEELGKTLQEAIDAKR